MLYPVAARGCLPPQANVCVAAPANQISSAIGIFQDFGHGGRESTFGVFPIPYFLNSVPFPLLSSPSTVPLSPRGVWGGAPAEIEVGAFTLKI